VLCSVPVFPEPEYINFLFMGREAKTFIIICAVAGGMTTGTKTQRCCLLKYKIYMAADSSAVFAFLFLQALFFYCFYSIYQRCQTTSLQCQPVISVKVVDLHSVAYILQSGCSSFFGSFTAGLQQIIYIRKSLFPFLSPVPDRLQL